MTIMVSLVGEQPIPNLLVVRHERPEGTVLVSTERTRNVAQRLESLLRPQIAVDHLRIADPFDLGQIRDSLREYLMARGHPEGGWVFNLTGGTKPMGFAAYRLAAELQSPFVYLQSEGKRSRLYRYELREGEYHKVADELLPGLITLDDYLRVHVGNYTQKPSGSNLGDRFERALAEALEEAGLEVKVGVALEGALEVDLVVRHENQVGVVQAKTGKAARKKDGLDQLNAACDQRYLGTYTEKILVINQRWDKTQTNLKELARAWGIRVVELPSFAEEHPRLSPEDRTRLQGQVREALGG